MNPASIPPLILASLSFYVGANHLFIHLHRRRRHEELFLALTCLAIGVYAVLGAGLYNAASVAEGVRWQRLQFIALAFFTTSFLWFAAEYTGLQRRFIIHGFTAYYVIAVVVQAVDRSPLTWIVADAAVKDILLPFGLRIAYHEAVLGWFTTVQGLVGLAASTYIFVLAIWYHRKGIRERSGPLLAALAVLYAAAINDTAVSQGIYPFIYLIEYAYTAMILLLSRTLTGAVLAGAAAEERYRALVENTADWVWEVDADFVYRYSSPNVKRMLGYEPHEVVGRSPLDFMPPGEVRRIAPVLDDLKATGQPIRGLENVCRAKDGKVVHLETSAEAFFDERGRLRGYRGIDRDVTDRVRTEEALRQAHAVVLNSPVVLFRWRAAPGWPVEMVSENVSRFGYAAAELLDGTVPYSTMVHPDDLARVADEVTRFTAAGLSEFQQEYRLVSRSGEVRWVDDRTLVVRDPTGEVTWYQGVLLDITERRRLELETQERRAFLESILHAAPDAIVTADARHAILEWNPGAADLFGFSREEAIGRSIDELITGGDPRIVAEAGRWTRTLQQTLRIPRSESVRYRKDGSPVDVLVSAAPILSGGAWAGMVVVYTDIRTQRRAAEQILRLNADLEQRVRQRTDDLLAVNRELEAFATSVAHDLRAPLRAMEGFSRALLEDCAGMLDEAGRSHVEHIRAAAKRMDELIDGLLGLSRVVRGELELRTIDLSALAREIAETLSRRDPARTVEYRIEEGLETLGDLRLVRAAMENLMENAWKFSGVRERAVIEVGRAACGGEPAFFVRDNGVGFDMAYADHLFKAFQRLHRAEEFPGIGLGLANVQRIVRRHGGRVWAESGVGRGATFWLTFSPGGGAA